MKNDHNYGYFADVSHSNWTGKTPRHSISGEYSSPEQRIPFSAYVVAVMVVAVIVLANFI